jgi:hypothetical protein
MLTFSNELRGEQASAIMRTFKNYLADALLILTAAATVVAQDRSGGPR